MGKTDDGGPAFPHSSLAPSKEMGQLVYTMYSDSRGMSVRQYLAAHAPMAQTLDSDGDGDEAPPWWYENKPKPERPEQAIDRLKQGDPKTRAEIWTDYRAAMKVWHRKNFFAWRWYYADQMLKIGKE